MRARFLVIGAGVCLQPPRGDLVTVLGTLGRARWRGRGRSKRPSRTGLARVCGDVGSVADGSSRRKWQGAQPGQGAAELLLPRRMLRKMQSEAACRADEPSGQGEDPLSEGLGGHDRLAQTEPGRPAGQRARLCAITCIASQAALAAKRPEGMWFSPTPYLRSCIAFSISAWRR